MKQFYEEAEMNIIHFDNAKIIVASAAEVTEYSYVKEDDETEILQ